MKIQLVCLILCLSSAVGVQLENLCSDDFFNYRGLLVNAFYRADQISDLTPMKYFIIAEWSSFNFFTDKTKYPDSDLRGEMEQIKRDLKHKIKEIYSEHYLNGLEFYSVQSERQFFDSIWERVEKVRRRTHKDDLRLFEEILYGVKRRPDEFINYLLPFQNNRLQPYDMFGLQPNKYAQMETLRQLLRDLDVNEHQTLAFEGDFIEDIYQQPIVSRPRFTFNRATNQLYDTASYLTLKYQIVLPFSNKLYNYSRPCVAAANLPRFFSSERNS